MTQQLHFIGRLLPNAMASKPEDKRREQLKRDQPLFTSRHHSSPAHQPPDFFTESLSTSHVASPHPTASRNGESARDGGRAKSRKILGTPRGLAASFKATADGHEDHSLFSPASLSEDKLNIPAQNSRVSHAGAAKSLRSTTTGRSSRRGTPSPNRARQNSSASIPPHGLAEAYQRIIDEENLAQEDSLEDDMGTYTSDYTDPERSHQDEQMFSQHVQGLDSVTPSHQPRNTSSRMHEEFSSPEERERKENLQVSGEGARNLNRGNPFETSPSKQATQYAKDLQRVHGALNSGAKAFRKGRVGRKVGLTVENLSRRNGSNESFGSPLGAGSVSSRGSDPSSNIPREWGRKARPGNDWLSRINSKSGRYTGDVSKRQGGDHTIPEDYDVEPLHEWVKTAPEEASSHYEDHSLSSPGSAPRSSAQNYSTERVTDWEINNDEFTGQSLQISNSPPIRIPTNPLNRDVDREIDSVAKKAVTTNRLDQLRERTPDERTKRRLRTRSAENLSHEAAAKAQPIPQPRRSSLKFQLGPAIGGKREPLDKSMTALGDEGDPIPDSPVVVYPATPASSSKENKLAASRGGTNRSTSRRDSSHGRHDSRDLLRQLARATSESPTPAKEDDHVGISSEVDREISARSDKKPKETQKVADRTETAENGNGDMGNRSTMQSEAGQIVQETPQPRSKLDIKTPLVTGAWIDTPLPNGGRGPPLPTPDSQDDEKNIDTKFGSESRKVAATDLIRSLNPNILSRRPESQSQEEPLINTGPLIPKSALESIISAAKAHSRSGGKKKSNFVNLDSDEDPTLLLGDSTIQSLEEILETDAKTSRLSRPSQQSSAFQSDDDHSVDEDLADTQKSSFSTVQSQISRLDHVGPSIRDAKRRLAFLERIVSQSKSRSSPADQCDEGGEIHDFIWPCERCMARAGRNVALSRPDLDGLATISITIPKLWRWRENDWRPRLTWLGVGVLVYWGYLFAEKVAW